MILRSLTKNLKDQDWFAVALELFIVILAVFIGFQVTAWNETRQANSAEHRALLRLQDEAEQVVAHWQEEVQFSQQSDENRRLLLEVLAAGDMTVEQRGAVEDAILRLGHYPHFNPPHSVYDELISAGGLSNISDLEVRQAVSGYAAEFDFVMGQLTQFRTNLPGLEKAYAGRIFSKFAPERSSLRRFEFDVGALAADREFVSAIVDAVRDQLQFTRYRKNALRKAVSMCEAISQALSVTCRVPKITVEEMKTRDGVNQ